MKKLLVKNESEQLNAIILIHEIVHQKYEENNINENINSNDSNNNDNNKENITPIESSSAKKRQPFSFKMNSISKKNINDNNNNNEIKTNTEKNRK